MARRILLLITDLQIGGTPTVVRELAIRLNAPGAHVEVACLATWGPVADQLRAAGITVTSLNAGSIWDIRIIGRLVRLIRDHKIDTVFSFLIHANAVAAAAKLCCPAVRFIQSIQTTQPWPRWHWLVQSIIQTAAEKIVVPSAAVAQVARDWADVQQDKIVVIPNAVDPARFKGIVFRSELTPPVRIGFVGRLDPIKRIPDLIEAMSLLDGRFVLHIFGEGIERARIEKLIASRTLNSRVWLSRAIARPELALSGIDILVLPSQAEGFGLVLIEAMAAGIAVVATDVPGIRDVVRNGQTGLLVPPGSPELLAKAISRIAEDNNLRRRLTTAADKDVAERFSWPAALGLYRGLLLTSVAV